MTAFCSHTQPPLIQEEAVELEMGAPLRNTAGLELRNEALHFCSPSLEVSRSAAGANSGKGVSLLLRALRRKGCVTS